MKRRIIMSIIITIISALLNAISVLFVLYLLGNVILPLFNLKMSIKIKFYKANKAL